jgi:hypothetical protein
MLAYQVAIVRAAQMDKFLGGWPAAITRRDAPQSLNRSICGDKP